MQQSKKVLWGLMLAGASHAACVQHYGSLTCGQGEVDSIHAAGQVVLQNTTVRQGVEVSGHLDAESAHLSTVHVQGAATLTQCTIDKSCRIEGSMMARDSTFRGTIDIYANQATLDNVQAQHIHMHHQGKTPPVLSISGNSHIQGDIAFTPSGGTIKVSPQAHIAGSVTGATIVKGDQ
jgi:cytoskeletal protein CcmA (bactofilin family)